MPKQAGNVDRNVRAQRCIHASSQYIDSHSIEALTPYLLRLYLYHPATIKIPSCSSRCFHSRAGDLNFLC